LSCSDWKEVTLGEIAVFKNGKSIKEEQRSEDGANLIYGSNGVMGRTDESLIDDPCIVIGRVGAYCGSVQLSMSPSWVTENAVVCINNSNADIEFLYYFLSHYPLRALASGSAQPLINQSTLKQIKLNIPPLKEQKLIAQILSSIDKKLELNNEINKTLQEMAHAIFKRWFVDFEFPNEDGEPYKSSGGTFVESELGMIPEGWRVDELGSILEIVKNSIKAGKHLEGLPYVPIDVIPMKKLGLDTYKSWEDAKSSLITFEKDDILLGAMRVYFHRVAIAPFKGITRTTTFVLRPKNEEDLPFSTLLLFQDSTISFANACSKGTTIPYTVWENGLEKMKFVIPPLHLRRRFNNLMKPMINKIRDHIFEQVMLEELKETLLPKLMSGKIRVPDAEREIEECLLKIS
jgi:type I restriction enzyme, S subunit